MPITRSRGKPRGLHGDVAHHVERIGDHDDDGLGRHPRDLLAHRAHDAGVGLDQVVPAHPRLPGDAGGHHEHLGAGRLVVALGADDPGVEALDRARLLLVERLALRHALDHVDHHHRAGQVLLGQPLRRGGAHVSRPDNGNFASIELILREGTSSLDSELTFPALECVTKRRKV